MTRDTTTTAAVTTGTPGLMTSTPVFWTLIVAAVTMTILLTGWTAAQAAVVNDIVDGDGPSHPSIRQVERTDQARSDQLRQLDAAETQRFANRSDVTGELPPSATRPTRRELQYLEYTELRRFRNRAPASALPALDAEIERLRAVLG